MAGKHAMEALQLHHKGYNCAQSVVIPFCEEFGLSKDMMVKAVEGFGGGFGSYKSVCGALSGAVFVAGLKISQSNITDGTCTKRDTYKRIAELAEEFKSICGSDLCPVIKGLETGKPLCGCDKCILTGVALVEKI